MTREEAIEWMDWLKMDVRERGYNDIVAALNMAIQALEQEPCDDCIKRKYIRKMLIDIDEAICVGDGFSYEYWKEKLAELPSVQPTVTPQEPILDKIYADIQKLRGCSCSCSDGIIDDIENILDKYKAESEK